MDSSGDLRRVRVALRAVLAGVKIGVLTVLLVGPTVGVVQSAAPSADGPGTECVQEALDQDRPTSALIRNGQGQVRQVSFDVAWDVYKGRRPGTVLAVCVDEPRRG